MKRTFIVEEVLRTEHKIIVEVADDLGIAEEEYDADEKAFDEVLNTIEVCNNLDTCKDYISIIYGVDDITVEEGVFETVNFEFSREE